MMFSLEGRHPIEHIIGFVGILLLHVLFIVGLIMMMHSPAKKDNDMPLQVQVVQVSSAASAAAVQAVQPPPPEMIIPPEPEVEPPPINTEAPVKPKKQQPKKVTRQQQLPREQPVKDTTKEQGHEGTGISRPPGVGTPDVSAGSQPLNGVKMTYPLDMQEAGKEGRVIVACDIESNGSTSNCRVLSSVGGSSFVQEALSYVHRARYRPAVLNNKPVKELNHRLTINFRLGGDD